MSEREPGFRPPRAFRRLAAGDDPEVLADLREIVGSAEAARRSGDFVAYRQLMSRFHRTLARGSGSAVLTGLMHQFISHSQFFVTSLTNDGLRRAHHNHRDIVNALAAGNVTLVLEIAQRHLQDNLRGVTRMQQGAKQRTPVDSTLACPTDPRLYLRRPLK